MVNESIHAVTPPIVAYLLALGPILDWNLNLILQVFKKPDIHNFVEFVRPDRCFVPDTPALIWRHLLKVLSSRYESRNRILEDGLNFANVLNARLSNGSKVIVGATTAQHSTTSFAADGDDALVITFGFSLPPHHRAGYQLHRIR